MRPQDHDAYVATMIERGINAGYELDGIHRHANPKTAVAEAEGIFVEAATRSASSPACIGSTCSTSSATACGTACRTSG